MSWVYSNVKYQNYKFYYLLLFSFLTVHVIICYLKNVADLNIISDKHDY